MTDEYAKAVRAMERDEKQFNELLEYWNSKKGRRVKHLSYLLIGRITDTMVVPVNSQPRLVIKWNNGAETSELPVNIKLMVLRRKRK